MAKKKIKIDTVERAKKALANAKNLPPAEKAEVKKQVCSRYPFIASCKEAE